MTLQDACRQSPSSIAHRVHRDGNGQTTVIGGPAGATAYPPADLAGDLQAVVSRPATPAEWMGHEDWEPQGLPTGATVTTGPDGRRVLVQPVNPNAAGKAPFCTNCMREGPDAVMGRACRACGVQGCRRCIDGRFGECDACLAAEGRIRV